MMIFQRLLRRWLVCAAMLSGLLALVAPAAHACVAAETGGVLGSVATQRVYSGTAITGVANFTFTCTGALLAVATGQPSLKGTLQASMTGLTLKNGANTIPYQIYSNSGYSAGYTGGLLVVDLNNINLISLLSGAGGNVPLYIATTPGANVPAGVYTDTVTLTWVYQNICEGLVSVINICLGVVNNGTAVRTITITLTVTNDCTITAPPVAFGSAPLVSAFGTVSQNISLLCSKNMVYTVGLSAGSYPTGGRRQMGTGAARLQYDIFKADNTVWGQSGTARANGPAAANGATTQTIPYTARIYQDQTTPAAGTYTDNVVVDVSF